MKNGKKKPVDLTIRDLTHRLKTEEVDPSLPRLPFSLLVTAKSETGKTNINMNILQHYKKYFKNSTFIFQGTPCKTVEKNLMSKKFNGVRFKDFFDRRGNNILEAIFKQQQEYFDNDEDPPHVLIYIDDLYNDLMKERFGILNTIYNAGRHYNISIIQVQHKWTLLDPFIRVAAKYHLFFRINSEAEKEKIAEDLCGSLNLNEKEFRIIFEHCTNKQYNNLLIDSLKCQFYHNLKLPTEAMEKLREYQNEQKQIQEIKRQKLLKK